MYTKVNLNKPAGISPGSAAPKSETIIVDVEDIQVFPLSDQNGVKLAGQFVLKPGASMIKMYGTKSKTDAPYESDGDTFYRLDQTGLSELFVTVVDDILFCQNS